MEYMDKGSLDGIYKKIGAIDIEVVGHVALAVLEGLTYLYDVHRIIHRGIHAYSFAMICADADARHQTIEYPLQLPRPNQDMRLWGIGRTY
jgi:hypothetical protein